MPESFKIAVFIIVAIGFALQLVVLIRQLARIRRSPRQTNASWPLQFPVHMLVYLVGISVAKWATGVWFGFNVLMTGMLLTGWWLIEESNSFSMLMMLYFFWSGMLQAWLPKPCTVGDEGIEFDELYPWDCVHRYEIKAGRLLLVVEKPRNRTMMQHVDIPLNGLSRELLPVLEQHLAVLTKKTPAGNRAGRAGSLA